VDQRRNRRATTAVSGATPTTTAAAELARTGSSTGAMTLVGAALVASGILALLGERRRA
jgi:LPXTG-motif cell wall-anchored protein